MPKTSLNVLLINPKAFPGQKPTKDMAFFPFSIVYVIHYLKQQDICRADYYDLVMESEDDLFARIEREQFDLIGVTCLAANRFIAIALIEEIRRRSPKTRIVVGGQFFGYFPDETLRRVPEVDFVVRGDGEYTTADLVETLDRGGDLAQVDGLSFRRGEEIIHNPKRKAEMQFERFFVDVDIIRKDGYDILQPMINMEWDKTKRAYPILVSKGCVNGCVYCINQNEVFRGMSLGFLLDRVQEVKEKYQTRYFLFTDPSFGSRPKFVRELCEEILRRGLDIEWYCETRPDLDLDILALMRKAGCISIHFAIESGSEKIMQLMRRRTSLKQVVAFAKKCNELGITYGYFTLVSFPDETLREAWETVRLVERLAHVGGFSGMAPLFVVPNTDLETMAKEKGVLPKDFDWFDRSYECGYSHCKDPVVKTMPHYLEHLTEKQIEKIMGWSLALQDFIHGKPRVRKLRYSFLKTHAFVCSSFFKAFSWADWRKKADVARVALTMLAWFWLWKARKPYYDFKEARHARHAA